MSSYNTCIWIAGASGRLGRALVKRFSKRVEYEVLTSDIDVPIDDRKEVIRFVKMNHPDVIINCAALTNVDYCENNPDEAYKVNAIGARNLAIAARRIDAKLIHISTDDVFNGTDVTPHNEFDIPNPTTVYGKSKYAGEELIKQLTYKHIIIRSSWIYGSNYEVIDRILEGAKKGKVISLPGHEFATPTSTRSLAKFIESLLDVSEYGIIHASDEGICTRADFVNEVLRLTGYTDVEVETQPGESLRPTFSVLDNMMMRIGDLHTMPNWKDDLKEHLVRRGIINE